jgi:predicted PurR-regulated permease PerM
VTDEGSDQTGAPVGARLDRRVEEKVEEEVEERVSEAVQEVEETVSEQTHRAEQARAGAVDAESGAQQAEAGALAAQQAAVEAAVLVAPPDDPLLDTAVRRIEARVDEENPFGVPGRPLSQRSPFRTAFSAALGVALAYGLVTALIEIQSVLLLLLTAAFLAIGLNPAVEALERRNMRRGFAVGGVLALVLAFFVGFGFAVVPPIVEQVQELVEQAPDYVDELRTNERVARLDERFGLLDRAEERLEDPERLGMTAAGGVLNVGRIVLGFLVSALTVLIVTLYFLANLPSIKANAFRLVPRTRRARVGLLTDEILSRVGGYVAGAVTIAGLASVLSFLLLQTLEVPFAVALAMVVFLTGLIPLIGATIGAVVITTVALFSSLQAGIVVAVWFLIYQQLENYLLYPRIMQRSVDVSPAATVVAVLIGGSLLGVLGALLAIPIAAAIQLVLNEVVAPRQDHL